MEFLGLDGTLGQLAYAMVVGLMILGVIIVFSGPAALLYPGLRKVVRWAVRASRNFLGMCWARVQACSDRIGEAFETLKGDTNVFIFSNNEKLYVGELRKIGKGISESTNSIRNYNRELLGGMSDLQTSMDGYRDSLKTIPQFSKISADYGDQAVQTAKDKSAARWAMFFVIVAAVVNTLLLGTAFDELLPRIPIPGIEILVPLGFVVAAIYTLMEFGIGFLLAMFTGAARALFVLVALALILAEVGVFSRMATNIVDSESTNAVFGLLETYGLLGLGLAVPAVLVGMGYVWKSARQRVTGAKAILTLKRDVDRANKLVDEMPGRIRSISAQADSSVEALEQFRANLGDGETAPRIAQSIQDSIEDLHANAEKVENARRDGYAQADENARTRSAFAALFMGAAIVAVSAFHVFLVQIMGTGLIGLRPWLVGCLSAAVALSLGMFLMRRVLMARVSETGEAAVAEGADQLWVRALLLIAVGLLVVGICAMAWTSGREYWLVWAAILSASTVGLALLGSRAADALGALWFLVRSVLVALDTAVAFLGWLITNAALVILKAALGIVAILAAPAQWVLRKISRRKRVRPSVDEPAAPVPVEPVIPVAAPTTA